MSPGGLRSEGADAPSQFEQLTGHFRVEELPNRSCEGKWIGTHVDDPVRRTLFNVAAMQPVMRRVREHRGGRLGSVLLHGPPGSGKTSLACGVANVFAEFGQQRDGKLTVLLTARCSEWASELLGRGPKAIAEAFKAIELVSRFRRVVVNVDEVESLAHDREQLSTGDPTDVQRAVTSLLTGMDGLPRSAEILFLATSNRLCAIDRAFLDRVDVVCHIDYPGRRAAAAILHDAAEAYRSTGITIASGVVDQVIAAVYGAATQLPRLSGRDLSDAFGLAIIENSTFNPTAAQVIQAIEHLQQRSNT